MSWRQVAVLALFVLGAVACAICGKDQLALMLAGGALGYASPDRVPWKTQKPDELPAGPKPPAS